MNRLFRRTVVLDGSGFDESVKVEDIASKVVGFFWLCECFVCSVHAWAYHPGYFRE